MTTNGISSLIFSPPFFRVGLGLWLTFGLRAFDLATAQELAVRPDLRLLYPSEDNSQHYDECGCDPVVRNRQNVAEK